MEGELQGRYLEGLEKEDVNGSIVCAAAVVRDSHRVLDVHTLRAAAANVQRKHPMTRARVSFVGSRKRLVFMPVEAAAAVVSEVDERLDLVDMVETLQHQEFDATGPGTFRCTARM
jgi:hypothetical protein